MGIKIRNEAINKKAEAFVLINTQLGEEDEALNFLKGLESVEYAHILYGIWDIMTKVSAPTMDDLKRLITKDIRGNGYVCSTRTLIVDKSI